MSVTSDPTQEAPREAVSFDDAFAALPREGVPAEDAPEQAQPDERPSQAPAEPAATPGADEPDDDDEQLPPDRRFARAQRREQKLVAERETLVAERQKAIDRANGYQGTWQQEKARREAIEQERDQFKVLAEDRNAALNKLWEDALAATPDPAEKANLQRQYDYDRQTRELAAEKAALAFEKQQREQETTRERQTRLASAEQGIRQHAIPELVQAIPRAAEAIGLPASEVRDLIAELQRPEIAILVQNLPAYDPDPQKWDVAKYRAMQESRLDQELARRATAYKERQAGATRQELAQTTYRQEQPVGQAGGEQFEDLGQYGTDFDAAFAANSRNHQRQLTAR